MVKVAITSQESYLPEIYKTNMKTLSSNFGFSLIELTISLLLLGSTAVLAGSLLTSWKRSVGQIEKREEIESALQLARTDLDCTQSIAASSCTSSIESPAILVSRGNRTIASWNSPVTFGNLALAATCAKQGNRYEFFVFDRTLSPVRRLHSVAFSCR